MSRRATTGDELTPPPAAMFDALAVGAAVVDTDGFVTATNARLREVLGHDLAGSRAASLFGGAAGWTRVRYCRPDGLGIVVDVHATDMRDGLRLAVVEDVTAQLRLQERVAVLEAFAEGSTDALFSQDAAGRIGSWSQSAERVFGYVDREILGRDLSVLFAEPLRPEIKVVLDAVVAGDRVQRYEIEAQRRDGMPVFISLSLSPLLDDGGRAVGSVSVAQDITEKRLAQASLAEVEARLREGEALAHVGRWLWDVGTGAVQWSEEFHRMHGVDPLEFAGTLDAYMACIHPADRAHTRDAMQGAVASGRPFEDEYRVTHGDGGERRIYARAEPMVGSADVVIGLRGIGQDVTDRRA